MLITFKDSFFVSLAALIRRKAFMHIQLTRPMVFFDVETTGIQITQDRIVEIAMVKIMPDGTQKTKRKLINPEMPIPPAVTEVHGITNEMVAQAPTFKEAAAEIKQFLENCDLAGYNSNRFDIPILHQEMYRAGHDLQLSKRKSVDVQKIFHQMEPRTLSAAYKFYCNKNLENAHSAEADATATWEIFESQLTRYPQLGNTVDTVMKALGEDDLVDFARRFIRINSVVQFNFGKHKGRAVTEVFTIEPQYYDWIMKGDFAQDTKEKLHELYLNWKLKKK